ncbi:hypothetical protein [Colwellia sp. 12G3]|uniref:hypothetical protein n=1 Tax=Colwellia sp. 12G3 TaxID=2058299 RepID=UPI000C32914D|nr:hypothetical protein [Colwellia sp. 12G3]PKI12717.1 hypothetical protein CXF71_18455 [Colwellia sp. 12G3]
MNYQQVFENFKKGALEKVDELIKENAYNTVLGDLKADGIDINDLSEDEFEALLVEEIAKQKNLSTGAAAGAGALFLLGLLG